MPNPASTVADLALPVPAGLADAAFPDPTTTGLLDYFGFWIKWALDAKLATMTKRPVADACPTGNRYAFNPASVIAAHNLPALFLWQEGRSEFVEWTTTRDARQRNFTLLYVYDRIVSIDEVRTYSGLITSVDAALARSVSRMGHPSYQNGLGIAQVLDLIKLEYLGGDEGLLSEIVQAGVRSAASTTGRDGVSRPRTGSSYGVQSGHPCLRASVRVLEPIRLDTFEEQDVATDILVTVRTEETGDLFNAADYLQGYLPAPDGSEDL